MNRWGIGEIRGDGERERERDTDTGAGAGADDDDDDFEQGNTASNRYKSRLTELS